MRLPRDLILGPPVSQQRPKSCGIFGLGGGGRKRCHEARFFDDILICQVGDMCISTL